jgi:HK97 family phage prohead protease
MPNENEIEIEEKLFKQFISTDTKVDSDERTVTAVISTGDVDRDREVLLPKGIVLEPFKKNPVVLWAHDYYGAPIGRAQWVTRKGNKITAKVEFAETEQATEVYELFKGGFLNAFSVGFKPLKSHQPTPDEIKKKPEWAEAWRIFDEWELLEFSVVPVPANAEALALAVKTKGLKLSDESIKALGIELDDEEPAAVYKGGTFDTSGDDETKTIPDEPPLIVVARHIPMKSHRTIRLLPHIEPAEVAATVGKLLKGKVS